MILSDNGVPQYRQLYEILKEHIASGLYKPGDILPSESAMCTTYSVTRPTVRQALDNLVQDGLIKKQQGKGSIVQQGRQGIGILSVKGTTQSLPPGSLETRVVSPPRITRWNYDFHFDITEEEAQSGCIRMSRQRLVNGQPVLYEVTNLPNINLPRFCSRSFENQSLFDTLLRHYNIKVTGGEQKIWALPAEGEVCNYLDVAEGQPILYLEKKYETTRPYYHFYTSIWSNTAGYYLQGTF